MFKCLECISKVSPKCVGSFAAGVLFGTAGIKVLSSRDAKKVYTKATAAVLRAKECVMNTAAEIQENAEDIYAEAQQINEDRVSAAAQEEEDAPAAVQEEEDAPAAVQEEEDAPATVQE